MNDLDRQAIDVISSALESGVDVAAFLATALCAIAAREGGVEEVLRNRPGSWEAMHIRGLMEGTVGPYGEELGRYRVDLTEEN
jgi:hypothetical protein